MADTFSINTEQLRSIITALPTTSCAASLSIDDCAPAICRRCMVCDMEIPTYNTYPMCDECRHRIRDMIYGTGNSDEYVFDGHIWEEEDR